MLCKQILDDLCQKYSIEHSDFALLHFFNPSQEIALADNSESFTPKAMVRTMENQLADFPKYYADEADAILMPDNSIIDIKGNAMPKSAFKNLIPFPWGWNKAVRSRFMKCGIPQTLMPTDQELDYIRMFAGRKFCVDFAKDLFSLMEDKAYARLLVGKNMKFLSQTDNLETNIESPVIFKQLWSSSGRGNFTASSIDHKMIQRLSGFCRNQGGFVMDEFYDKTLDFAMEFYLSAKGKAQFIGYSVFNTENNGKYQGNWLKDQNELKRMITDALDPSIELDDLKEAHIRMLEKHLAGKYCGFVGIDMMAVDANGKRACHPSVEINVRMNMGVVAMVVDQRLRRDGAGGGAGAVEDGAVRRSSTRESTPDRRERGFHTSLKSCLISIRYS